MNTLAKTIISKAIVITIGVIIGMAIACGIVWLLWIAWCWAIPQIWTSGPENLTHPNFWLFLCVWMIFVTFVGVIKR